MLTDFLPYLIITIFHFLLNQYTYMSKILFYFVPMWLLDIVGLSLSIEIMSLLKQKTFNNSFLMLR